MKWAAVVLGTLVGVAVVWLVVAVAGLRGDMRELREDVAKLATRREVRAPPAMPPTERPPRVGDAGPSEQERYQQALAHFRAQPADDDWAAPTARQLEKLRDELLPELDGVSYGPAECRQSECILEVRWGGGQQPRELMMGVDALRVAVTEKLGGQLHGMVSRPDADGSVGQYFFHFARGDAAAALPAARGAPGQAAPPGRAPTGQPAPPGGPAPAGQPAPAPRGF